MPLLSKTRIVCEMLSTSFNKCLVIGILIIVVVNLFVGFSYNFCFVSLFVFVLELSRYHDSPLFLCYVTRDVELSNVNVLFVICAWIWKHCATISY